MTAELAFGAGAGAATGIASAFAFALLHITAKRWRNGVLVARGEAPYKDVIFTFSPWWIIFGTLGAIAGGITAAATDAWWPSSVLAAAALPALLTVVALAGTAAQARRSISDRAR